jgi:urease accessory protein
VAQDGAALRVEAIVGWASDAAVTDRLHELDHRGAVETVLLSDDAARRHRLRAVTDRGRVVEIALDRDSRLGDGAILLLDEDRAVVVRLPAAEWLELVPADVDAALALGHLAGHLHWRVRFDGGRLAVALDGPEDDYRRRLAPLLDAGAVRIVPS